MKNYYDILGVSEDASNEQIKNAFKSIAKKEHPDRGGNEAVFKEANEAYDTLKDTKKRQEYDTIRKYGQPGTGGHFTYRSGDFFGEMAILDGNFRSANALAQEKCELITINKEDFLDLLKNLGAKIDNMHLN